MRVLDGTSGLNFEDVDAMLAAADVEESADKGRSGKRSKAARYARLF